MIATAPSPAAPKYAPRIRMIANDPALFARKMLKHNLWWMQEQILRSAARYPRTAVKACHASSKTFTAAELVLWWIARFKDGIAITTASSFNQVKRQLWVEMKRAAGTSLLVYPRFHQTELRISASNYAIGLSTNAGIRFQGFHGRILVVIDEATGIDPEIWEAIESSRAGGDVHLLALGNPIELGGHFYDIFHSKRTGWQTFTMSAFDSPNFKGLAGSDPVDLEGLLALPDAQLDDNVRPYLITRRWVKEKYFEWGPDDPRWNPRVLGQFPKSSSKQVISLEDVEACVDIELRDWKKKPLDFGGDIARFGDDQTVYVGVKGGRLVFLETHAKQSTMETAGQIVNLFREIGIIGSFALDDGGLGGGVTDRLTEQNYEILPINFGSTAFRYDEYQDLRTEIWWHMRRLFAERLISIPRNEELIMQLVGPTYEFRSNGKLKLESKEDMKKRGLRSPDIADALGLAVYPRQWISQVNVR
jgi:phage terminase large subunit